jgi:effector-binding domain-containing protein
MSYEFQLTCEQAQPVLSIRTRTSAGNLPQELGKVYEAVYKYISEIGAKPLDSVFTAYYNMDMEDLDIEAGVTVSEAVEGRGEILSSEIPAGKMASCMYKGPYSGMGPVYDGMNKWMSENGHTPTGICYEFYYNSPQEVPESELLTKIVFPLK